MDSTKISKTQLIVAIIAIVYCIAPDPLIGPVDDILIAAIAATTDIILGISKQHFSIEDNNNRDFDF